MKYEKPETICDCSCCSKRNSCTYAEKFQRLPRSAGGLGLCPNLPENKK